jgi:hypothetical protein
VIVKIISLFLIGMVVLAMFGRLRLPRLPGSKRLAQTKCPKCGRFRIGKGPCGCGPSGKGRRT